MILANKGRRLETRCLWDHVEGLAKMRILVCGINYAPELVGVGKYNTELCEALSAKGHDVRVITAPPYYPSWSVAPPYKAWAWTSETRNKVRLQRVPIYVPRLPSSVRRLLHHASFALTSSVPIVVTALRWRPQIIFAVAPSLMSAPAAAIAARIVGARSWLHIQDFEIDAAFGLGLLRSDRLRTSMLAIERYILRRFDRISTISPQMLLRLEQKQVPLAKLREIRNGVDTSAILQGERMTEFRQRLSIGVDDIVALYSGTMSNKQGIELIVDAAKELKRTNPNIHFILCGEGPQRASLETIAAGFANIHFLPLQPADRFSELLATDGVIGRPACG
jgi:colanic acid biosynthesis glycosyl transferase WcaI